MIHRVRFALYATVTLSLLMVSALTVSAQEATPAAGCPATTPDENEAIARRWYDDLWNPQDAAIIDGLLSADHIHHWAIGPDTEGAAAFAARAEATWTAFPVEYTVEEAIAEGGLVVLRWSGEGIHQAEFGGLPATGNPVAFTGINFFRIECGKIAEVWSELDGLGLIGQMGGTVLPATAATPTG